MVRLGTAYRHLNSHGITHPDEVKSWMLMKYDQVLPNGKCIQAPKNNEALLLGDGQDEGEPGRLEQDEDPAEVLETRTTQQKML